MIIYKCPVTGDEMFSDANPVKLVDDCVYEVTCRYTSRGSENIKLAGSNPSAEEAEEKLDDGQSESGLDVVFTHRLVSVPMEKKAFTSWVRDYCKKLVEMWGDIDAEELASRKNRLKTGAGILMKKIKDLDSYVGESMETVCSMGFLEYREIDGVEHPIMLYLKDGVVQEKY